MRKWLSPLLLIGLWAGCAEEPAPAPPPPAAEEPEDAAPPPPPVDRETLEEPDILAVGPDRAWGVAVPAGCRAHGAWRSWIEYRCYPGMERVERFYRFRFPGAKVERSGRGVVVRPNITAGGYARIQPFRHLRERSRVLVYKGNWTGPDEGAEAVYRRINPGGEPQLAPPPGEEAPPLDPPP